MFNQEARWDRDLPCEENGGYGPVISVTCLMERGKITPQSFFWKNRTFSIQKIHFTWAKKQGREDLVFYSVLTAAGTYELALRKNSFLWHLMRLSGP
ncbi:MAG: hypothetical protein WC732_03915 [Candidatus Omnitrophota bacterium]